MPRFLLLGLSILLCTAAEADAQTSLFRFEGAAETRQGTRTLVQDSTAGLGLTVASYDSDWQARDVDGFGRTEGRAAYALVGTEQVTLSFSEPVHLVALHAATVYGSETWRFTDAAGHTVEAVVTGEGTSVALDVTTTLLTITSEAGKFFPLLDDVEVGQARATTDAAPEAPAPEALAVALYPQPVASTGHARVTGLGADARVTLFDALGRSVAVLHDGPARAELALSLDAQDLAAGTYLLVVESGGRRETHPFVVAR